MRRGLLPTLLGTAVLTSGSAAHGANAGDRGMEKRDLMTLAGAGLVGYGLASTLHRARGRKK